MFDINDMLFGRANLTRSGGSALTFDTTDSDLAGYATARISIGRAAFGRALWFTAIVEKAGAVSGSPLKIHLDISLDDGANYREDVVVLEFEDGLKGAQSAPINTLFRAEEVATAADIVAFCRVTADTDGSADDWDRVVAGLTIAPMQTYGRAETADTFQSIP